MDDRPTPHDIHKAIKAAYPTLSPMDKEHVDQAAAIIMERCKFPRMSRDSALELLAKVGMALAGKRVGDLWQ